MTEQRCPFNRLEKVLLATDGSRFGKGAIREALRLSGKCSSKLIAVSVIKTNLEFEVAMPQVVDKVEEVAMEHAGVFLPSDKPKFMEGTDAQNVIHIHLISKTSKAAGQIDNITLGEGMLLRLPKQQ